MVFDPNIVLVTRDSDTADIVTVLLHEGKGVNIAAVYSDIGQFENNLSDVTAGILIVDIDPDKQTILGAIASIVNQYPEKRIIVISSSFNEELILEAMQAGVRHFLKKTALASELPKVLVQLMSACGKRRDKLGFIISVFSAGGGCGGTTVAVNIADELRMKTKKTVLMIDLDKFFGMLAAYFGVSGKYSFADVLDYDGPIDRDLIETAAYHYMKDFHVFGSVADNHSSQNYPFGYNRLSEAADACREAYKFTIIDAPRLDDVVEKELARISRVILVVFQPTVKDVNFAKKKVSGLIKAGIEPVKIICVVNRFEKRSQLLGLEDVKKALGLNSVYPVRSDWRRAISSINQGRPVNKIAPWSGLRRDFRKLALHVDMFSKEIITVKS